MTDVLNLIPNHETLGCPTNPLCEIYTLLNLPRYYAIIIAAVVGSLLENLNDLGLGCSVYYCEVLKAVSVFGERNSDIVGVTQIYSD